ncbi:single-stranded DNA-binding protein [Vagococcus vulneris]|uniref:Single-stranded DNA-binding protein n=1 Tax=Vagococcus vulneris TaxID=1977869 RepID=A0A429ZTK2_9ENTE|nr:single-stranded DNA-binding protein [Vagococcus vulneris]RST96969.1 single-stranded DNA-binding protein [Vagococcus vulneris]
MINNVVLVGRLTKDPDLRFTSNGIATASFTLAVNRNFKNASGEREADFINCVIWRKPAETLANYARKGALLGVVGRIQTRNYENQQGQRVYVTEVVCENFQLLESKKDNQQSSNQNSNQSNQQHQNFNQNNQNYSQPTMDGMGQFGNSEHIDKGDNWPF